MTREENKELRIIEKDLMKAVKHHDVEGQLYLKLSKADILLECARFEDSHHELEECIHLAQQNSFPKLLLECLAKDADCLIELGRLKTAFDIANNLLQFSMNSNDKIMQQKAHYTIGRIRDCQFSEQQDAMKFDELSSHNTILHPQELLTQSLEHYKIAFDLHSQLSLTKGEANDLKARIDLNISIVLYKLNNIEESYEHLQKAIELSNTHALHSIGCQCHLNIAQIYSSKFEYDKALRCIDIAFDLASKSKSQALKFDSILAKCQNLINEERYQESLDLLVSQYKYFRNNDDIHNKMNFQYKKIKKISKLKQQIKNYKTNEATLVELYERIADSACEIESYGLALKYYDLCVKNAKNLNFKPTDIAKFYYSLAITFLDLNDIENSLKYFAKDVTICTEGPKRDISLLKMADCKIRLKRPARDIESLLISPLESDEWSIKAEALLTASFICKQENDDSKKYQKELMDHIKMKPINENSDVNVDSNDCSGESDSQIDSASNFSTLSQHDLEKSNECIERPNKICNVKRNERGETKLHLAAQNGDIAKIKSLISRKHPVNCRDAAGWLPIHEAANFGDLKAIKVLLDNGAWINDNEGQNCDKITPLIDSAINGHIKVVKLLLEYGADESLKDKWGRDYIYFLQQYIKNENVPPDVSEEIAKFILSKNRPINPREPNIDDSKIIEEISSKRSKYDRSFLSNVALIDEVDYMNCQKAFNDDNNSEDSYNLSDEDISSRESLDSPKIKIKYTEDVEQNDNDNDITSFSNPTKKVIDHISSSSDEEFPNNIEQEFCIQNISDIVQTNPLILSSKALCIKDLQINTQVAVDLCNILRKFHRLQSLKVYALLFDDKVCENLFWKLLNFYLSDNEVKKMLKSLRIGNTDISEIDFGAMTELQELSLKNCRFSSEFYQDNILSLQFRNLKVFEFIDSDIIPDTVITIRDILKILDQTRLKTLEIIGNISVDEQITDKFTMNKLKKLSLKLKNQKKLDLKKIINIIERFKSLEELNLINFLLRDLDELKLLLSFATIALIDLKILRLTITDASFQSYKKSTQELFDFFSTKCTKLDLLELNFSSDLKILQHEENVTISDEKLQLCLFPSFVSIQKLS
ncbi:MAG: hypothetical protein MHMPM18_000802 [Marteilia pararefringens]